MKKKEKNNGWLKKFEIEFLQKSGEHLIEIGITGSGKTQGMYWILEGLLQKTNETIVWFDTGKSSEILTLSKFGDLNIIIPNNTDIKIMNGEIDFDLQKFNNPKEIWTKLIKPGKINIISIEPYILCPVTYTKLLSKLFTDLIQLAHNYKIQTPMAIFFDEFHRIAPSKGNALDFKQFSMGAIIQHNIERLRSLKIRFISSSHGWLKIRSGIRNSFSWILARRGCQFSRDQPKLNRFNPLFEKMNTNSGIIVFPTKVFTDILILPWFNDGETLGRTHYIGEYLEK